MWWQALRTLDKNRREIVEFTHEVMAERDGTLHPIIGGFTGFNREEAETRTRKLNANREDNPFVVVSRLDSPVENWGA